jgi:mono/diheme cytochrome c family protein
MIGSLVLWAASIVPGATLAEPLFYKLPDDVAAFRPGPGIEVAQSNCLSCHSADYINFQPPKKGQAFWEAEVQKMIKVYRAPISEKDAKEIVDYLAETY